MFVHRYDNPAYIDLACHRFHSVIDKTTEAINVDAHQQRLAAVLRHDTCRYNIKMILNMTLIQKQVSKNPVSLRTFY